jgi:hypothetical protein
MSSGDPEDLLIADLGFWAVRARSGSRENPPQDEPPQGAVEPLATERAQLARGTGGRCGQPGRLLILEHGEPPQTAGRQGQMDKPMDGQQRVALI